MPEGTRRRGSWERVKTRVSRVSEVLRGSTEGTGDDGVETRQPAKPGDPDDKVEGARVEAVEMAVSEASRGVEEWPGEVGNDENRPGTPEEPPNEPQVESNDPDSVQVKPGGKTIVK